MKESNEDEQKITVKVMKEMIPRRIYAFRFDTANAFITSLRHAHWIREHHPRTDGLRYRISSNSTDMTIIIKVDTP